jgi:hypothetical protein
MRLSAALDEDGHVTQSDVLNQSTLEIESESFSVLLGRVISNA